MFHLSIPEKGTFNVLNYYFRNESFYQVFIIIISYHNYTFYYYFCIF